MSLITISFAVYQNEGSLIILHDEIVSELSRNFPHHDYELLFVNDGSEDGSLKELQELRQKNPKVRIISFSRNFGQMAAILAAWENAKGDCVINMAADLQDPPSQVSLMINEWLEGNEIVISYRQSHKTNWRKKITSKLFYKLMLPNVPPGGFDFALIDRKPMDAINSLKERNRFYQYDILWAGFRIKYLPYDKVERKIGQSQYNFLKRLGNFYSAFLNVSYLPLRLLTFVGVAISILGFLYAGTILYAYFMLDVPFQGWAPIMMTLLIVGGMLMLMLGVIGEYIWRILDEVKGRPYYIIDEEV